MIIHTSTLTPHFHHGLWPVPGHVGNHTPQLPTGQGQLWWRKKSPQSREEIPQSRQTQLMLSVESP